VDLKNGTYNYIVIAEVHKSTSILVKLTKRISGPTNNISTVIIYIEKVEGIWGPPDSLTDDQKVMLQEFNQNWGKAFEIL
jgi:hypothetical protein